MLPVPTRAIVRPPGRSYPQALTSLTPPPEVDLALALAQHRGYAEALRAAGLQVIELPPDEAHPDAVFVQDPVLVVGGRAIVLRSAAPSRQGEAGALVAVLAQHLPLCHLQAPATLDGGDVLATEDRLFVGLSTRSTPDALTQLAAMVGFPVEGVRLPRGLLHLLSGCTYLGAGLLLTIGALARSFPHCDPVIVPDEEAGAANVLVIGARVIVPAGYPLVAALLAGQGFQVIPVASSEFEKRDGGVTCRAVLF